MTTIFYDQLIPWPTIHSHLLSLGIDKTEQLEILELWEETIHSEILLVILDHLPRHKHQEFLILFHQAPEESTHWIYLKTHAHPNIESLISDKLNLVVTQLLAEPLSV